MSTYFLLVFEFFKTGLFAVGGGLATLPFLREMAHRYPWFTMEELLNMIAVSESTPGPIGVNMATYVGFTVGGVPGGILATMALVLPSIIIIVIIASYMERFQDSVLIQRGFYLLRAATAGLIGGAIFEVVILSLFNTSAFQMTGQFMQLIRWPALTLFVVLLVLIRRFPKVHPIVFILASAAVGIALKL